MVEVRRSDRPVRPQKISNVAYLISLFPPDLTIRFVLVFGRPVSSIKSSSYLSQWSQGASATLVFGREFDDSIIQ